MGNEIEIKDLDVTSTSFLPTEIKDIDGITEIYSLEDEFAKTKKNKNIMMFLSIGFFFVLVIGSAFVFSVYIQQKNQSVEINISEFEDLRLKEVIDSARSHENNLDLLLIKYEILKVDHQKKILGAKQKFYKSELNLLAQELPLKETNTRIAQIRRAERREIAAINKSFEDELKTKAQEIEDAKQEIAEKKAAEEAKGEKKAVSNVDRLNELKMEQLKKSNDSGVVALREYYENYINYLTALYNPAFGSAHANSVIETGKKLEVSRASGYHPLLQQEQITNYSNYENIRQKNRDSQFLLNRVRRVPFKGSIAPALEAISTMTRSISGDYEDLLRKSVGLIQYKNGIINNFEKAFDEMLTGKSESGYIINADNQNAIHVHLNEVYRKPINATALVFREADEYIGRIKLSKTEHDGILRASVVELVDQKRLMPFDKILLEIN